jgi:phage-related protein
MVMAVVKPAFDFLIGQLDSIGRFVVGIVVPAFRWVVDQLDQIGRGAMAAARGILTALSWIGTNVTAAFVGIGTWLWNAGVSLITGLIGGIGSMARSAANAAIDVARGAVNGVKNFLGIGSPSKVFRQIGSNVGEGLVVGLDQSHNMVASAAAGMANAMLSASQYNYNIGGPGTVQVNMPQGSNGNDVVRALRDWQKINGRIPVAVTGRNV